MTARLAPLPTDADGAPVTVDPTWLPVDPTDGTVADLARRGTPVAGGRRTQGGVALTEVGFLFHEDRDHDVAVHLNGLTDRHRTDLTGARLARIPGTSWWQRTYLLPEDGTFSYRFVSQPDLPHDLGRTRPGWRKMHEWGVPDPHQSRRLVNPLGGVSSIWQGGAALAHPDWDTDPTGVEGGWSRRLEVAVEGPAATLLLGPQGGRDRRLLVLLDAQIWSALEVESRLARLGAEFDLLLLDSGSLEQRADLLPHPGRFGSRLERVLAQAGAQSGQVWAPRNVLLAGQSYGGLAAAQTVARRPDLAGIAVAQSGSYWFGAEGAAARGEGHGELLRWLESGARVTGRFLLQAGSEEGAMADLTWQAGELLSAAGGAVTHREFRGGHDYAWWRHGLSLALDEVLDEGDVP